VNKPIVHSTKEDSLVSVKISDPYYRGKPLYICIAKEWFDKVNGNSYWSARVENIERYYICFSLAVWVWRSIIARGDESIKFISL